MWLYFRFLGLISICMADGLPAGVVSDGTDVSASQIKCEDYSKLVTDDQCKITDKTSETGDAVLGEMPHMASVGCISKSGKMECLCGGALISVDHVLTFGHCAAMVQFFLDTKNGDDSDVFVRLAEVQRETQDSGVQVIRIAGTVRHPKFDTNDEKSLHYNVGLIRLATSAELNTNVRPACLNTGEPLNSNPLIISHWKPGEAQTKILRKLKCKAGLHDECKLNYHSENHNDDSAEVCITAEDEDICTGDGANILQMVSTAPSCSYKLIGINGARGCLSSNRPKNSYFIRLAPLIPWIESVVWPKSA